MNKTQNYYSTNASLLSPRYESANVSELQSKLLNNFKNKHKILELGCGSGRDAAYSIATLMHLEEPQVNLVIRELSNLLKQGGTLFFSVSIARNDINKLGFDEKGRFF